MNTVLIGLLLSAQPPGAGGGAPPSLPTLGTSSASFFFGFTEEQPPNQADRMHLLLPSLDQPQRQLRDFAVRNWLDGNPPLTLQQVHARARTLVPGNDPGTALLVCHNVLRAFARASRGVYWQRVQDWLSQQRSANPAFTIAPQTFVAPISDSALRPLRGHWVGDNLDFNGPPLADVNGLPTAEAAPQPFDYTDGAGHFYRPAAISPAAGGQIVRWGSRNRDSIFWLLFDPRESPRTADPGDWYQFFLAAAAAYYAAEGRAVLNETLGPEWERSSIVASTLGRILQAFMRGVERYEGRSNVTLTELDPSRVGWLWANALSFIEGGLYGQTDFMSAEAAQQDAVRESVCHRDGARFGLAISLGGEENVPTWNWYIPRVNALQREAARHLTPAATVQALRFGIEKAWKDYVINIQQLSQFIHDHHQELGPFIENLDREGPGLDDIKAFPH